MTVYVLPTIDAEGVHGDPPFDKNMLGLLDNGERWGVHKLSEVFNEFGVQGTFFLDVYEYSFYGEDAFKTLTTDLLTLGQDIQLHTHPAWYEDERDFDFINEMKRTRSCFDPQRWWMWQYTLDEQVEILEHGIDCLERWGAPRPVAHRAGAYGANEDTMAALRRVGIPVDSSQFLGHQNCKVTWKKNQVSYEDGLLELPVTGFDCQRWLKLGPLRRQRASTFIKTDVDWCSLGELIASLDYARANDGRTLNLFMHSNTLLDFTPDFTVYGPDHGDLQKLRAFLAYCADCPDVEVLSVAQLWERVQGDPTVLIGSDSAPVLDRITPVVPKLLEKAGLRGN